MKAMKKTVLKTKAPAKRAVRRGVTTTPAAKSTAAAPKAAKRRLKVVSATLSGGYRVFNSPVRPRHVTPEAILEAVAAID